MVISARCIIEPMAIYLTAELLGLIELIHAMRIVHADIKPDNFLLCHTPSSSRFVDNIGHPSNASSAMQGYLWILAHYTEIIKHTCWSIISQTRAKLAADWLWQSHWPWLGKSGRPNPISWATPGSYNKRRCLTSSFDIVYVLLLGVVVSGAYVTFY